MPTASVTVKIPISLEIIAAIRAGHFDHQEGTLSDGAADLSLTALGYTISAVKALPNHPMLRPAEESFELQIRDTEGRVILVPVQVTSKITVKELARRVSKLTGLLTKQMFLLHKGEKIFNGAEEQHPDAHLADLHSLGVDSSSVIKFRLTTCSKVLEDPAEEEKERGRQLVALFGYSAP